LKIGFLFKSEITIMILMGETKAGRLGRFLAIYIGYAIREMPADGKKEYCKKIEQVISDSALNDELAEIEEFNPACPEHAGRLVKQIANLQYNLNTRRNTIEGFLREL
jgi:hypothetical protein